MERQLTEPIPADTVIYRTVDVTIRLSVYSNSEYAEYNAEQEVERVVKAEGWEVRSAKLIET